MRVIQLMQVIQVMQIIQVMREMQVMHVIKVMQVMQVSQAHLWVHFRVISQIAVTNENQCNDNFSINSDEN